MLAKAIIRESSSPWVAPAILVPKRSVGGKLKYRFCVDFRAANAVTKFDPYPLPVFEETTSTLLRSKYFTVLDCYSGFWQINIKQEHKEEQASLFLSVIMNIIDCPSACQIALRTFRG
jgi:hypothetical protein